MATESANVFELRTVQGGCMRSLIEVLKEILTDINILVQAPNKETDFKGGLRLMTMDSSNVALVHLQLDGDKFEMFHCEKNLVLGVNMMCLYRLTKSIGNNDVLSLFVAKNNSNALGVKIVNTDKKTSTTFYLRLLDVDDVQIRVPEVDLTNVIYMSSVDFQQLVRNMSGIANSVDISVEGGTMTLSCEGDFASQKTEITTEDEGDAMQNAETHAASGLLKGKFSLRFLASFAKATSLCSLVEMYMRESYPLILLYRVANLGRLRFALAPQIEE